MDNGVMTILLIIFGALTAVGIITALIMKKIRVHENVLTIAILITSFFALLAAGITVFLVSVNMMKEYVNIKRYGEYTLTNEEKSASLFIKEYSANDTTGFEIYLAEDKEKMLGDISTDKYLPFRAGEYMAEWSGDKVTVFFTFHRKGDSYQSKSVTVSLKDGTVSPSVNSDVDLRPVAESRKASVA